MKLQHLKRSDGVRYTIEFSNIDKLNHNTRFYYVCSNSFRYAMYVRNAQLKYVLHMHDAQIYKRKSSIWKLLVDKHLFQEYRILKFYIDNKHNIVKKDVTEEFIFTEKLNLI